MIEPGTFPTAKVTGGYDFVGDDYDPDSDTPANTDPAARPGPARLQRPRLARGRHRGRQRCHRDGRTFAGPYNETTLNNDLRGRARCGPRGDPDALQGLRLRRAPRRDSA